MYKQFEKSSSDTHMTSPGVDHLPLTAPVRGLVVPRHRRAVPRTGGLGNVCGEGGHRVSDPAARTGRSPQENAQGQYRSQLENAQGQ